MSQRISIYPSDVELILGRSNRHCREILQKIREQLQKESHQSISFCEFADYMGLKREAVFNAINKLPVLMEEE